MRIAVFDLDGTLADTSIDLLAAANAALAEAGRGMPLDAVRDRAIAFQGGRAMLRAGLERLDGGWDEAEIATYLPRLLDFYGRAIVANTFLYDGVEDALDRIEAAGWGCAVCTNKPAGLAEDLLNKLGLRARFRSMLGADSLDVRKPDPRHVLETIARAGGRVEAAVMIGDTRTDRDAARNAGIPCVLVGFGPAGAKVAALDPEAVLDHYADLPDLLDRLMPAEMPA